MASTRTVLGIDAAWTEKRPSGVALASEADGLWRLDAVTPSYDAFLARAGIAPQARSVTSGHVPDPAALVRAAAIIAGREVDMVAVDMPLSLLPITGRREADDAVSRRYGGRRCGTHTPSAERPGELSDRLRIDFDRLGYGLRVEGHAPAMPGLIEVYPHPALIELTGSPERLPYKASETARYQRTEKEPSKRRENLFAEWRRIVAALDRRIAGVAAALSPHEGPTIGRDLKAYEDMIDAIVCAWVATTVLDGKAEAYGDGDAAIWIPSPVGAAAM